MSPPASQLQRADGSGVDVEVVEGICEADLDDWQNAWRPYVAQLRRTQRGALQLPPKEHEHWNWRQMMERRSGLLSSQGFAIRCDGHTQGLMLLDTVEHRCQISEQARMDLVYIEYLEVAPWNLRAFGAPRFLAVGSMLLALAVRYSRALGFKGRIGLHALPQSRGFYTSRGMTNLGSGLPHATMDYFEATVAQADIIAGD
ncbi:hypothetical protein A7326_06175 [Stenotrophomonas maltophilia]|nr:hypothetical protein A7326_06175 [Stenotrophomonas maltophilia]